MGFCRRKPVALNMICGNFVLTSYLGAALISEFCRHGYLSDHQIEIVYLIKNADKLGIQMIFLW